MRVECVKKEIDMYLSSRNVKAASRSSRYIIDTRVLTRRILSDTMYAIMRVRAKNKTTSSSKRKGFSDELKRTTRISSEYDGVCRRSIKER